MHHTQLQRWAVGGGAGAPPRTHTYPTLLAVPPGLYCRECHQTLNNVCSICMGPLSYKDMGDEEM